MACDIMLDLETMGVGPDAAVVAIGACAFDVDANAIMSRFYRAVDLESSVKTGGKITASTVTWWLQQEQAARDALTQDAKPVTEAVADFRGWYQACTGMSEHTQVWGNGPDFDNVIMMQLFKRLELPQLWTHKQNRDYRTIKNLRLDIPKPDVGPKHIAVADAVAQALHLMEIVKQGVPPRKRAITADELVAHRAEQRLQEGETKP